MSTPAIETPAAETAVKAAKRSAPVKPRATLAAAATKVKAAKRKPVFADVPGIPRVALADGTVGCVQAEMILCADGSIDHGPHMLTIPRRNADGTESGARFPLAQIQLLAEGFARAGLKLV